jgi:hypothetical protein
MKVSQFFEGTQAQIDARPISNMQLLRNPAGQQFFLDFNNRRQRVPIHTTVTAPTEISQGDHNLLFYVRRDREILMRDGATLRGITPIELAAWGKNNHWFGRNTQSGTTVALTVNTLTGDFRRVDGNMVTIRFSNANTAANPTLSVDGTLASQILRAGRRITGGLDSWSTDEQVTLVFNSAAGGYEIAGVRDLISRPDLWVVGTEYNFGQGLFGKRFTGTITAAVNVRFERYIELNCEWKTVKSGGNVQMGSAWYNMPLGQSAYAWTSPFGVTKYSCIDGNGADMYLVSQSSMARTNAPYDIWVLYRKV